MWRFHMTLNEKPRRMSKIIKKGVNRPSANRISQVWRGGLGNVFPVLPANDTNPVSNGEHYDFDSRMVPIDNALAHKSSHETSIYT